MARLQFAQGSSKTVKRTQGRSTVERIAVVTRSADKLGSVFEERIRKQLASRVGHAAGVLERVTVRFEDVNGPKGGVDIVCRIKAVLARRPSILVEKRAESHARAFSLASAALGVAVNRAQEKYGLRTGASGRRGAGAPKATAMLEDSGSRPSRKNTRSSANGKPRQTKKRAAAARMKTPAARSSRRG